MTDRKSFLANSGAPKVLFVVNEAHFFLSHRRFLGFSLLEKGYEVHVAAPGHHAWAPPGFDPSELEKSGFVFHPIRLSRRGQNPVVELITLFDIWRLLCRLGPEVVHLLTIKPIIYGGIAARWARTPRVVCAFTGLGQVFFEDTYWAKMRRTLVKALLRYVMHNKRAVAVVQNLVDREIVAGLQPGQTSQPTLVKGSGIPLKDYPFRPLPTGTPVVMLAARLLWEKGIGTFVDAARILKARGVDAKFVIVGATVEANPRSVPRLQLEGWEKEGVVEWWGYRSDMVDVLSECTVFCLPTVYREGIPRVLLEVAAIGRPIVTSNIGGCGEIVVDGLNGFTCQPSDAEAVAAGVHRLLSDPGLCAQMAIANRQIAERDFDVEEVIEKTIRTYVP